MKLYGRVGGVETEIGGGGVSIQVTSLPTASASLVGTIYQYVGTTSGSTINSHFYKCVPGSTSGTYEWVDTMDSTPTENSTNPITSGGVYDALQTAGGGISVVTIYNDVVATKTTTTNPTTIDPNPNDKLFFGYIWNSSNTMREYSFIMPIPASGQSIYAPAGVTSFIPSGSTESLLFVFSVYYNNTTNKLELGVRTRSSESTIEHASIQNRKVTLYAIR